jgi:hypothetical protein
MHTSLRVAVLVAFAAAVPSGALAAGSGRSIHQPTARPAAACSRWNIGGTWASSQANGVHVTFHLKQHGTRLTGTTVNPASEAAQLGYTTGTLRGTITGNHFDVVTDWQKSTVNGVSNIGKYYGTVTAHRIVGYGRNIAAGQSHQALTWAARGTAHCIKH